MKILLIIIAALTPLYISAQKASKKKSEPTAVFDPQNNILVRFDEKSNNYNISVNSEILGRSALMADPRLESVDSIFTSKFNTGNLYLVFHCTDYEGNSRKKAILLRELSKGIYKSAPDDTETPVCLVCEGVCCNECNFRITPDGPAGCDCPQQCAAAIEDIPGYCNQILGYKVASVLSVLN